MKPISFFNKIYHVSVMYPNGSIEELGYYRGSKRSIRRDLELDKQFNEDKIISYSIESKKDHEEFLRWREEESWDL